MILETQDSISGDIKRMNRTIMKTSRAIEVQHEAPCRGDAKSVSAIALRCLSPVLMVSVLNIRARFIGQSHEVSFNMVCWPLTDDSVLMLPS